ncbi:MAG: bifunctional oligoribonuclease/PAP phosphatase NrnA [Dysgonamonadaceae bacterium]|jgi:phosphoesterase RecJ-like protein|nr:bifunctional oligoribonuclease/PAP phosphatase NrnA [Dysgonamonadaceae bacterium]
MLNKIISEDNIQSAKKLINKADKIVIFSHRSPDGDAIGSSLGLYHFLNELGKQVNVIVPNDYPVFLNWMPDCDQILVDENNRELAKETVEAADLIFCLDFNGKKRVGTMEPLLDVSPVKKIMIDHHPDPESFCDITISHPEISSTSELIFRFICRMGDFELITKACAECIYAGMMTDTCAFTLNSNSPAIYYIISQLLEKDIDKDDIYAKTFNRNTENKMRFNGFVLLKRMKVLKRYKTAVITLSTDDIIKFGVQKGDTEGIVNLPMSIEDVTLSALFREEKDVIRISLRSKGFFPSNKIAKDIFGGGGHLNASGGEFHGSLDDAVAAFTKALPDYERLLT